MTNRKHGWAGMLLSGVALLTGCTGFWNPPASSGGGGNSNASGVFYVLNQQTSQVAGFSIPSGATKPAAVSGSPYALPATAPLALAIAPQGKVLYVSTSLGIYAYSVGSSGALTLLNSGQPIDQNDVPTTLSVDSTGSWLLAATSGLGVLTAIPVTSAGTFDSTRKVQTANLPGTAIEQLAVSPANSTNAYVYVAMGGSGTGVLPFTAGSATPFSTITTYKVKNTGGSDNTIGVDPTNRLLYVGETAALTGKQSGGLRVYTVGASAALTEVTGSPLATGGTGPTAIVATANYVYVGNRSVSGSTKGNVTVYPVTSSGGSYSLGTLVNTLDAGQEVSGLARESTGTYLLAVNIGGNPDLNTFTFDSATGKIVAGTAVATGTDPVQAIAIAAVP